MDKLNTDIERAMDRLNILLGKDINYWSCVLNKANVGNVHLRGNDNNTISMVQCINQDGGVRSLIGFKSKKEVLRFLENNYKILLLMEK